MVLVRAASSSRGAAGRRHRPELTDVGPDGIVVRLSSLCSADLSHTSQLRLMPELTPDAIRNATLTRRLRGFDRAETEELLARVAESYGKLYAARTHRCRRNFRRTRVNRVNAWPDLPYARKRSSRRWRCSPPSSRKRRRRRRFRQIRGRFPNVPVEQPRRYFDWIESSKALSERPVERRR